MKRSQSIFALAFIVTLAIVGGSRPASAAAAMPAALSALVGNWSCTYTGPKGTSHSTYAISKVSDLWVQGSGDEGAYPGRPAHKAFFLIGYDPKKHMYVSMGGDTLAGDYGTSTAKADATAMKMTYVNAYPADPTHEQDVWTYTPTTIAIASAWTEKGKAMTSKGSCTKQ
ncbi:MAG TPA: DUF1579 family protein [Candidatus Baltobacteraceae bacterium]|jgi:hypothetical protein|nr:DUF1579 family protein [Candidatus Baltobacteraceae bacterium]